MIRREFITLLGGAVAAPWPVVAHAQQPSMPVIGFLGSATAKQWAPLMGAFLEGLSEAEIVVGRRFCETLFLFVSVRRRGSLRNGARERREWPCKPSVTIVGNSL